MASGKQLPINRIVLGTGLLGIAIIGIRTAHAARIEISQFVFEGLSLILNRHKKTSEDGDEMVTKHYGWVEAPDWGTIHLGAVRVPRRA